MADHSGDGTAGTRPVSRKHTRSSGFTLLEMLVVLALLAIFAATLAGGLRFGVQADRYVGRRALSNDGMQRAERFLRERLSVVQPIWVIGELKGHVAFMGGPADMVFFAPTPQSFGGVGLSRYVLHVETDGDFSRLSVRVSATRSIDAKSEVLSSVDMLNGARLMRFAYYGKLLSSDRFGWQSAWIDRTEMPQLISIHVQADDTNRASIVDVILRPYVDIDVQCQLNIQTASCLGH